MLRACGADVVGMPSEFVYLQRDDLTVRRWHDRLTACRQRLPGAVG